MKKIKMTFKNLSFLIPIGFSLVWLSCDDRTPTKSTVTGPIPVYKLAVNCQSMALDNSQNTVIVGEDLEGSETFTRITAQLTDEKNAGLTGQTIIFSALANGQPTGSFVYAGADTVDENGIIQVDYVDSDPAMDNPSTPIFEGVVVTATFTQVGFPTNPDTTVTLSKTIQFEVIDTSVTQVWPYRVILTPDPAVIYADTGDTKSLLTVSLMNNVYKPLEGLLVQFDVSPDTIGLLDIPYVVTDTSGKGIVEFTNTGNPNLTGTVNITASFFHPQFGTSYHTRSVSIIKLSDQTPVNLSLTTQPVSGPASSPVIVGEDVNDLVGSGDPVRTKITTRATDDNGTPLSGKQIQFFAIIGSDTAENAFDYNQASTNSEGYATVNFFDNGQSAVDNIATPEYEGVTVVAYIDDNTAIAQFNVYEQQSDVWPYHIYLNVDNDVIYIDGGITKSLFSVTVKNKDYFPLENLQVQFEADPDSIGFFDSGYIITDSLGQGSVEYLDTGDPDLAGSVEVIARFNHPLFGNISEDQQISVIELQDQTVVNLSLTAQPVVGPNNNFVIVGEDINDDASGATVPVRTRIIATVTDAAGDPLSGKLIDFFAIFGSDTSSGNFDLDYITSDAQGLAWVNFYDNGESAIDNIGTPTYEGVTVVAYIDDVIAETRFNVYDQVSDVWPYRLNLTKDRDFINLDNGLTKAEITAVLSNQLNKPLKNVEINFSADLGYINDVSVTDTTGTAIEYFTDLGDPADVGISTITANYQHPSFGLVTDMLQISIIDPSTSGIPAYIVIPASHPGDIMVTGGGGLESTNICAQVYDENGLLVDVPMDVTFELGPTSPFGAAFSNDLDSITTTSTDGVACVSLNSGVEPGPVYIIATVNDSISATGIPVIIVTGPAFNIFPDVDITSVEPIGGGFYRMEAGALVHDLYGNPVADTTYVYWTIDVAPADANDTIDVEIIGVSYTNNQNLDLGNYPGMAFTSLIFPSSAIFDWGRIIAYSYGAGGVIVIDSVENDAIMPYFGDELSLDASLIYWDFSTMGNPVGSPAMITLTATLIDGYGNPVEGGRIFFTAPAGTIFGANPALTDENGQALVMAQWTSAVCTPIPNSDPQLYNNFEASCVAVLLDPLQITSDPRDIQFIRSYQLPIPPINRDNVSNK